MERLHEKGMFIRFILLACPLERACFFAPQGFERNRAQPIAPSLDILVNLSWRIDYLALPGSFGEISGGKTG